MEHHKLFVQYWIYILLWEFSSVHNCIVWDNMPQFAKLSSMCSVNPATSFLCPGQYHHKPRIINGIKLKVELL